MFTRLTIVFFLLFLVSSCGDDSTTAGTTTDGAAAPRTDSMMDAVVGQSGATPDMARVDATQPDAATTVDMMPPADVSAPDGAVIPDAGAPPRPGLPDGPSSARLTPRPLGSTELGQGFVEYLPVGYGNGERFPLLVFLHGIGSNGDGDGQLRQVLGNGIPKLINNDQWPSDRPFIVLSPQHPGEGCHTAAETGALMEHALANYDVDRSRVYMTGLSCGGIGTWTHLAAFTNQYVVAAVPIAGNGRRAWTRSGCEMRRVAIWAFHGDADARVNVEGTRETVQNLRTCEGEGLKELQMTIYPGVGHDSWTRTYNGNAGPDNYSWLLTHQREPVE